MKLATEQKSMEEILTGLSRASKVFVVGCGTCTAVFRTGGRDEVLAMVEALREAGKEVTGWLVIPTTCDDLTLGALKEHAREISATDALLVTSCSLGVQTVADALPEKPVYPAVDTMFIGKEGDLGAYREICVQCGECVIGRTGGICPVTSCAKGMMNGPCGGMNEGKCEADKTKDCVWVQIYDRLAAQDRLDEFRELHPPKDYSKWLTPRRARVDI
jgi:hypothetical protein